MKKLLSAALLLCTGAFAAAPKPDLTDVKYGPADRNVLDVWLPKGEKPAPLAIFVHGGGFTGGDKAGIKPDVLQDLLAAGFAVASVNYRYRNGLPDGALDSMRDCVRALQYLRSRAAEWGIDPSRVGMWGGSAGAATSLWIAFHDDMADPASADPVLRQSTRLQAAGANSVQSTYDMLQWPALYGQGNIPSAERARLLEFMGMKTMEEAESPEGKQVRAELDIIAWMTPDDPPFWLSTLQPADLPPVSQNQAVHHPLHVKRLAEKASEIGVECVAIAPGYGMNSKISIQQFFKDHLTERRPASGEF